MDDTISRAAVIDVVAKWIFEVFGIKESDGTATVFKRLRELPSAQQDIIRCKDCKHYIRHDKRCGYWNHGVKPTMWCSQAERRGVTE